MKLLTDYFTYSKSNPVSEMYLIETKSSRVRDISWVYEFADMKVGMYIVTLLLLCTVIIIINRHLEMP